MTSFDTIYKRFLNKISDVKLLELSDDDIQEMLFEWLTSSIAKFKKCKTDLSDRDDELMMFNNNLLDIEVEILAIMMVHEWLEPQLESTLLTSQFFGTSEERFFAQANQIDKLMALSNKSKLEARKLMRDYGYQDYISVNLDSGGVR